MKPANRLWLLTLSVTSDAHNGVISGMVFLPAFPKFAMSLTDRDLVPSDDVWPNTYCLLLQESPNVTS